MISQNCSSISIRLPCKKLLRFVLPGFPGTNYDCLQAVSHLKQLSENHPIDLHNVALLGHSAGGTLALWVASEVKRQNLDIGVKVRSWRP